MRNAVGTQADRRVFTQHYWVLPNFHECFINAIGTWRTCLFLFQVWEAVISSIGPWSEQLITSCMYVATLNTCTALGLLLDMFEYCRKLALKFRIWKTWCNNLHILKAYWFIQLGVKVLNVWSFSFGGSYVSIWLGSEACPLHWSTLTQSKWVFYHTTFTDFLG